MQWWKVLGVAAFIGVAATGVLFERAERSHHDYTPEQIRDRLHARAAEAPSNGTVAVLPSAEPRRTARFVRAGRQFRTTMGEAGNRIGLRLRPRRRKA